jgi:hypothetical protein
MSAGTTRSDRIGSWSTLTRYDLLLALLPVPLLLGASLSRWTSIPETLGVGAGSLCAALLVIYAITVGAPTVSERSA